VVLVVVVVFLIYAYLKPDFITSLRRYGISRWGPGAGVSEKTKQSLSPLEVVRSDTPPVEYSYKYSIPPWDRRRSVLITVPADSRVKLNGESVVEFVESTDTTKTFSGHLYTGVSLNVLEVFTRRETVPIIEFVQEGKRDYEWCDESE
jgi:hypothetical protein